MRSLIAMVVLGVMGCSPSREPSVVYEVDWPSVARSLEAQVDGFDTYVQHRGTSEWITVRLDEIATRSHGEDIAHLIIAVSEEMEPWEKEKPIQELRDKLPQFEGLEAYVLISRSEPYYGYFLSLSPKGTLPD